MKTYLLLSVFVLTIFSGEATRCYVAINPNDVYFDSIECVPMANYPACAKMVMDYANGTHLYARNCVGYILSNSFSTDINTVAAHIYLCAGDLCNSAAPATISLFLIFTTFAAYIRAYIV